MWFTPVRFVCFSCVFQESVGEEGEAMENLGAMGWRLGVPMCKVSRDRHGPKGQWVSYSSNCMLSVSLASSLSSLRHVPRIMLLFLEPVTCPPSKHFQPKPHAYSKILRSSSTVLGLCRDAPSTPQPSPCPSPVLVAAPPTKRTTMTPRDSSRERPT